MPDAAVGAGETHDQRGAWIPLYIPGAPFATLPIAVRQKFSHEHFDSLGERPGNVTRGYHGASPSRPPVSQALIAARTFRLTWPRTRTTSPFPSKCERAVCQRSRVAHTLIERLLEQSFGQFFD
jgi:hypothetical protein